MTNTLLLVDTADGVATVTLNRPDAMNALSRALRTAIVETLGRLSADPAIDVIILTGSGRAFSAGLDLKELGSGSDDDKQVAISGADVVGALARCPQPIIGAINGFAITGGFELALACDVLVCSTAARFADTHARVGILPGWGLSQKLSRTIGIYRAKELSLTGNYLSAEQAYAWGLANRVVAPDELLPACRALAQDMRSCDRTSLLGYKRVIDEGFQTTFGEGLRIETAAARTHAKAVTPDAIAARRATVQERGRSQSH